MELIDKAVLTERINKFVDLAPDTAMHLEDCISGTPVIDAVEVVFCKNCIYRATAKVNCKGFTICPASNMEITDNDYCSYGAKS